MAYLTNYRPTEIRTGTFRYGNEIYHVDAAGDVYRWDSHEDLGGFFSKIGNALKKVAQAPLKLVQKAASLTPITKKIAAHDIVLKLEQKKNDFEAKHVFDPKQAAADIKKAAPYVAVAVAAYFGFGQVAAAALSAYQKRKAALEAARLQAEGDAAMQAQIDEQIRQADAEIARLNSAAPAAAGSQARLEQLANEWNAYQQKLLSDPANAAKYKARIAAIEAEMLTISNAAKALPTVTVPSMPDATQWRSSSPIPAPLQTSAVVAAPAPGGGYQPVPQASEAVDAYFTRPGLATGNGIVDVTKPAPEQAAAAASWIKPALIAGAALLTLTK